MEFVYVALISGIFSLIGIYLLYTLQTRKMKLEQKYKITRFKLGNKFKLKSNEMPENIQNKTIGTTAIEKIIEKYAPQILGEEEEETGDLGDIISNIVANNPDIVEKYAPELIKRFTGDKNKKENIVWEE